MFYIPILFKNFIIKKLKLVESFVFYMDIKTDFDIGERNQA